MLERTRDALLNLVSVVVIVLGFVIAYNAGRLRASEEISTVRHDVALVSAQLSECGKAPRLR